MIHTLLPIYTFGKRVGLHPLHLMGVDANIGTAASRVEIHPLFQYSWQSADAVSREELALAIYEAEQELADYMGFLPASDWTADERIELVATRPGSWPASWRDINMDYISFKTDRGKLISGGRVVQTLIQAAVPVVYTDADTDTYKETATITVATSVTDTEEIAVYYPGDSDEWQVRPITVSIVAGVATITCRREQLVIRDKLEALDAQPVAGLTDSNFLTTVDVYRRYHDPSVQVQMVWRGTGCNSCGGDGCQGCGLTVQNGCMTVKDKDLGIATFQPGDWNRETLVFDTVLPDVCRRPDYVRVWYRSGHKLSTSYLTMDPMYQLAVSKLALGKLDREIPSSQALNEVQRAWNSDLRRSQGNRTGSNSFKVTNYELENCPFGTTVAAVQVWRWARRNSLCL